MPTNRKSRNGSAPELSPPDGGAVLTSSDPSPGAGTAPTLVEPHDDLSLVTTTVPDTAGPSLLPPQHDPSRAAAAAAGDAVTAAVWTYNRTVSATWSINETRNAWILVDGVGWKKIFNGTDGAFTALTTLAAQARQTGHAVSFREDGGLVREIYLW